MASCGKDGQVPLEIVDENWSASLYVRLHCVDKSCRRDRSWCCRSKPLMIAFKFFTGSWPFCVNNINTKTKKTQKIMPNWASNFIFSLKEQTCTFTWVFKQHRVHTLWSLNHDWSYFAFFRINCIHQNLYFTLPTHYVNKYSMKVAGWLAATLQKVQFECPGAWFTRKIKLIEKLLEKLLENFLEKLLENALFLDLVNQDWNLSIGNAPFSQYAKEFFQEI